MRFPTKEIVRVVLAAMLAACGGDSTAPIAPVSSLQVSPGTLSLLIGARTALSVTLTGSGFAGLTRPKDFSPAQLGACASSNHAEIFFVIAPDASGRISETSAQLVDGLIGIFAHELHHMISYGQGGGDPEWLEEGASYDTQEQLFFRQAGLGPRLNLTSDFATPAAKTAFNDIAGMFSAYFFFLTHTESTSPFGNVGDQAARVAGWSLIRFAIDQKPWSEASNWRAFSGSNSGGGSRFKYFGDMSTVVRAWALSNIVDDAVSAVASSYTFPSWNYRGFHFTSGALVAPMLRPLSAAPTTVAQVTGGSSYFHFGVNANATAAVRALSDGFVPSAEFMLLRTK